LLNHQKFLFHFILQQRVFIQVHVFDLINHLLFSLLDMELFDFLLNVLLLLRNNSAFVHKIISVVIFSMLKLFIKKLK